MWKHNGTRSQHVLMHACVDVHGHHVDTTETLFFSINVLYGYGHGSEIAELHLHDANVVEQTIHRVINI